MALRKIFNKETGQAQLVEERELTFWLQSGWSTTNPLVASQDPSGPGTPGRPVQGPGLIPEQPPSPGFIVFRLGSDLTLANGVSISAGTDITFADLNRFWPDQFPASMTLQEAEALDPFDIFKTIQSTQPTDPNIPEFDLSLPDPTTIGGGGGRAGPRPPEYRAPDRRLIEDYARATLVALTGTAQDGDIQAFSDLYLTEDRRNFDNPNQDIDPRESVKVGIRKRDDYKAIHQLRPESLDEFQWVSDRRGSLLRAGVAPDLAEEIAIEQATVGATTQQAAEAGVTATFAGQKQALPQFMQSMRQSSQAALGLL